MTMFAAFDGGALVVFAVCCGLFGAAAASYLGVVAERGWKGSADGRSVCVCGRQLTSLENIPVVSWVVLRGRCKCRQVSVPVRYVASEAGLGLATGLTVFFGGVLAGLVVLVAGGVVVLQMNRRSVGGDGPVCVEVSGCPDGGTCENCLK